MTYTKSPPSPFKHWKLKLLAFGLIFSIMVTFFVNSMYYAVELAYRKINPTEKVIHRMLVPDEMIPAILHDVPDKQKDTVLLGQRRTIAWLKNHDYLDVEPCNIHRLDNWCGVFAPEGGGTGVSSASAIKLTNDPNK